MSFDKREEEVKQELPESQKVAIGSDTQVHLLVDCDDTMCVKKQDAANNIPGFMNEPLMNALSLLQDFIKNQGSETHAALFSTFDPVGPLVANLKTLAGGSSARLRVACRSFLAQALKTEESAIELCFSLTPIIDIALNNLNNQVELSVADKALKTALEGFDERVLAIEHEIKKVGKVPHWLIESKNLTRFKLDNIVDGYNNLFAKEKLLTNFKLCYEAAKEKSNIEAAKDILDAAQSFFINALRPGKTKTGERNVDDAKKFKEKICNEFLNSFHPKVRSKLERLIRQWPASEGKQPGNVDNFLIALMQRFNTWKEGDWDAYKLCFNALFDLFQYGFDDEYFEENYPSRYTEKVGKACRFHTDLLSIGHFISILSVIKTLAKKMKVYEGESKIGNDAKVSDLIECYDKHNGLTILADNKAINFEKLTVGIDGPCANKQVMLINRLQKLMQQSSMQSERLILVFDDKSSVIEMAKAMDKRINQLSKESALRNTHIIAFKVADFKQHSAFESAFKNPATLELHWLDNFARQFEGFANKPQVADRMCDLKIMAFLEEKLPEQAEKTSVPGTFGQPDYAQSFRKFYKQQQEQNEAFLQQLVNKGATQAFIDWINQANSSEKANAVSYASPISENNSEPTVEQLKALLCFMGAMDPTYNEVLLVDNKQAIVKCIENFLSNGEDSIPVSLSSYLRTAYIGPLSASAKLVTEVNSQAVYSSSTP